MFVPGSERAEPEPCQERSWCQAEDRPNLREVGEQEKGKARSRQTKAAAADPKGGKISMLCSSAMQ